ncbi:sulfurtransferase TusA family protein [Rhodopirellula sp. JC740]|uniref:Sulfurtransferase TusA family protein n=2 Tax=Rhodopirellula halodulae TaxID=2894198 RepID=A0ABS8NN12_9BACT|nr:sulfurtransferase TusA family protein [Rhodopirellula sp. JC740]MCC9658931.1 sulfurtransferase TusA family protein [Rhodopirellula sp. JC737]
MPIVELTKAARKADPGDHIVVTATDLAFRPDVEAWARRTGHEIERFEQHETEQVVEIVLSEGH